MKLLKNLAITAWDLSSFVWYNPKYFAPKESKVQAFGSLAIDAVEAIVWLFNSDRAADALWDQATDKQSAA